jgi:acyl carrier protein
MTEIETQIKQFVLDTFLFGGSLDDIKDEESFIANGTLDSLGVLTLISFVEETYGIEVADDEVVPENFDSVRGLATYVRTKMNVPTAVAA